MNTSIVSQGTMSDVRKLITNNKQALETLIPQGSKADCRVMTILEQIEYQVKFGKNGDKIRSCSPHSIASAIKFCCQLGLEPGYGNGAADVYLIPYNGELKAQTSYVGELKMAQQSQKYKKVFTRVVYEQDQFREWVDETGEHFTHEVSSKGDRDDDAVAFVYAVAIDHTGSVHMKTMSKDQVDELEKKTRKKGQSPAWKDWWQAMAQKTVLRQLLKTLPRTKEMMLSETQDNEAIDLGPVQITPAKRTVENLLASPEPKAEEA